MGEHAAPRLNRTVALALELGLRGLILLAVVSHHPFSYDVHGYWRRMHHISLDHLPFRDFLWEFPPLTVLVTLPARWLSQSAFTAIFAAEMLAAEYATLLVLRRRFPRATAPVTRYWTAVALPLASQAWFRLDFLSALLATWALLVILDGRSGAVPIVLGYLAKLWPAVLAALLVAERRYRQTAIVIVSVAAATACWVAFSPSGFGDFLRYRHGSGIQIESLVGAPLFAAGARVISASDSYVVDAGRLGWVDGALLAGFCVLVLASLVLGRHRRIRPVPYAAGLVIALMLCSRILSPQYVVWAVPFATLMWAEGERRGTTLFAAAAWLTAILDWGYADFVAGDTRLQVAVIVRNLLLAVAAALFLRSAFTERTTASEVELVGAR